MRRYEFLTSWLIDAPRERVFEAIHGAADYPRWWRGVESVHELEPGDADGVGSLARDTWKSRLPYRLEFDVRVTTVVRPHLLAGEATGDLAGDGTWRLYESAAGTAATFAWNVRTTRTWMNALTPVLRPAFTSNHHKVMRQGAEGLAALLGATLVAAG